MLCDAMGFLKLIKDKEAYSMCMHFEESCGLSELYIDGQKEKFEFLNHDFDVTPNNHVSLADLLKSTHCVRTKKHRYLVIIEEKITRINNRFEIPLFNADRIVTQAIKKETKYHNMVLDQIEAGFWTWEIQSGKLYWSEKIFEMFGYDMQVDQPTYARFLESIHPADRELVAKEVDRSVADPNYSYQVEHRIINAADKSEMWLMETGKVFRDKDDNPYKMVGIVQNITSRKSKDNKLEELERKLIESRVVSQMSELTNSICHEINNPLSILIDHTNYLKKQIKGFSNSQESEKKLKKMEEIVWSIAGVIKNFKASNFEKKAESFLPIKIGGIIEKVMFLTKLSAAQSNVELRFKIDSPDELVVLGREVELIQVFLNLINNAIDSIVENGNDNREIKILVFSENNCVKVLVVDSGKGVEEKYKEKIFDLFYTSKGYGNGRGLGLNMSKKIIKNHGGSLELVNLKPTTFRFSLPFNK